MGTWEAVANARKDKKHELLLSGSEISTKIAEGGIDDDLFELVDLNYLSVHETCLTAVPDQISKLVNLQTLVLHSNKLDSVSAGIGLLSKMKVLDLSRNQLKTVPVELTNLTQLTSLNLSSNCIETFHPLTKLTKLCVLDLANNKLTDVACICNVELVNLADVKLNGNCIETIPVTIGALPALKNLDLNTNKITSVPGELYDCNKLKEINLKSNPIADKRLLKLIDQCRSKQVLDYVKQHCPRSEPNVQSTKGGKAGKKGGKNDEPTADSQADRDDLCHKISVLHASDTTINVKISDEVKTVRGHILCCIVSDVSFDEASFKRFIQMQTKLHDTVCEKRNAATIATHDLAKLKPGDLCYMAKAPQALKIHPLGRAKAYSGAQLFQQLQNEAETLRKEKKRNVYSGIHRFLYLLEGKPLYPCLVDSDNMVVSFPPITNSDNTKMSVGTTSMLIEVTSAASQTTCRKVLDQVVRETLLLGIGKQRNNTTKHDLTVRQVKIVDFEGNLKSVYPSRNDLLYEGDKSIIVTRD